MSQRQYNNRRAPAKKTASQSSTPEASTKQTVPAETAPTVAAPTTVTPSATKAPTQTKKQTKPTTTRQPATTNPASTTTTSAPVAPEQAAASSSAPAETPSQEPQEEDNKKFRGSYSQKAKIAKAFFNCDPEALSAFEFEDPLNGNLTVSGYICKQTGLMGGSLCIVEVGGEKLEKPQLIYGTPKLTYAYKKNSSEYVDSFEKDISSYLLTRKWNGTNILFFKYYDHNGRLRISAKTKGAAAINDSSYGAFLTETLKALEITSLEGLDLVADPPSVYLAQFIKDPTLQSYSFEICGRNLPHLVKYEFNIDLKPLFVISTNGQIKPVITADKNCEIGPLPYKSDAEIVDLCKKVQNDDYNENVEFRKQNGLQHRYEYEHFAQEGWVLYLLDKEGRLIDRTMYKIKPKDVEEVHWAKFDNNKKAQVKDVLKKMGERNIEVNEKNLQDELDCGPKEWGKFSKEILAYVKWVQGGEKGTFNFVSRRGYRRGNNKKKTRATN